MNYFGALILLFAVVVSPTPIQAVPYLEKRALVKTSTLWQIGSDVRIKFLKDPKYEGSICGDTDRSLVKLGINTWRPNVNLNFYFVEDGDAEVRIFCNHSMSSHSMTGSDSLGKPDESSLNFAGYAALHELGHAIGYIHEQFNPSIPFEYNCSASIVTEKVVTKKMSREDACDEAKKEYNEGGFSGNLAEYQYSQFDFNSVMLYGAPGDFLSRKTDLVDKDKLSTMDKVFALGLYPFQAYRDINPLHSERQLVPTLLSGKVFENLEPEQCADGYSVVKVGEASCCAQSLNSNLKRLVFANHGVIYVVVRVWVQDKDGSDIEQLMAARLDNMRNHIYGAKNLYGINSLGQLYTKQNALQETLNIERQNVTINDGLLGFQDRYAYVGGPFEHSIGFRPKADGIVDSFKLV